MEQEDESGGEESEDGPEARRGNAEDVPEPGEMRCEDEEAIEESEAEGNAGGGVSGDVDEKPGIEEVEAGEGWEEPGDVE